ncbi:MAG: N-succinylarginine dihydrolase [Verrucomicrobiales bacterium]|nr:N-succinylarginine dihydrolase [Verrucomicrobiales bacterium]
MIEVNFDGLVSPTHNYAGLAIGNLASTSSGGGVSRPREAALQGLEKMMTLVNRGVPQAFFPPQLRPSLPTLRKLGFEGSDAEVLKTAFETAPGIFAACSSASSMWTANAATVAPSEETADRKVHFTPANLVTNFHRSIEVAETAQMLRSIFRDESCFAHHDPLPATALFADEGAANHTRLDGVHLFVYGSVSGDRKDRPSRFPARQTLEACQAIARLHQLPAERCVFIRQNPEVIDAGVFHNDVISVGHETVFLYHEEAFADGENAIQEIVGQCPHHLAIIKVPASEISVERVVKTYLFNSQIVTLPDGGMLMLCPTECQEDNRVYKFIVDNILGGENPIREVVYRDLKQSMKNGGGPACLRLRVGLTEKEIAALPPRVFLSAGTFGFLESWVKKYYPEELEISDLVDFERYKRNAIALSKLNSWLGIA